MMILLTAAAASATACESASASAPAILSVNPSVIKPGFSVGVHATCGDNLNPAFVTSKAFGSLTLVPEHGRLRSNVTVPPNTKAGTYTVSLSCASGQKASTKLTVLSKSGRSGKPGKLPNTQNGPHTGGGEMASGAKGKLILYGGIGAVASGLALWFALGVRRRGRV